MTYALGSVSYIHAGSYKFDTSVIYEGYVW
jgi:hypothetical protein